MATYQKWEQSYAPKVTTIKLTYRGVKYNKMCASSQSVHYSTHYPWFLLLLRSGRQGWHSLIVFKSNLSHTHFDPYFFLLSCVKSKDKWTSQSLIRVTGHHQILKLVTTKIQIVHLFIYMVIKLQPTTITL